jgi:hypothetical protein
MDKATQKTNRISENRDSFAEMLLTLGYELGKDKAAELLAKPKSILNSDMTLERATLGYAGILRDDMINRHNAEYGEIDIKNFN